MKRKLIITAILTIIIAVFGIWYYVFIFSKYNHRNITNEEAIKISAVDIVKQYQINENEANTKFLNKAIELTGIIENIERNQENKMVIAVKSSDPMSMVYCTLEDTATILTINTNILIKGVCIGYTTDVKIKDAFIIK